MQVNKEFKVVAVSENTNSFGLKEMIMVAKDGTAYKGCFNSLNIKTKGETIIGVSSINDNGELLNTVFSGGELVNPLLSPSLEIVKEIWN